jgi:hypothetical protein
MPIGLWDVENTTFSRQSAHRWRWGRQPYAPAALYPPGRFLVLISVRGWVDPKATVRLKWLGQLKYPITSSGIEPATCHIVRISICDKESKLEIRSQQIFPNLKTNLTYLSCWRSPPFILTILQSIYFISFAEYSLYMVQCLKKGEMAILMVCRGRAIAQAVSRRFPTAAARVRSQVRSCGICGGQSGTGASFLRILRFSLPVLIPPTTLHLPSIIRGWYNTPNVGRRSKWTQSHPTPRN